MCSVCSVDTVGKVGNEVLSTVKKIIDFFGLRSDSPEDGFWYGIDRQLKTKLIAMSVVLALAVLAVAHFLFRGIDVLPQSLPWWLALLAYIWSLNLAKKRHSDPNGAN